eukprot:3772549-Amphidinium_carterae.1
MALACAAMVVMVVADCAGCGCRAEDDFIGVATELLLPYASTHALLSRSIDMPACIAFCPQWQIMMLCTCRWIDVDGIVGLNEDITWPQVGRFMERAGDRNVMAGNQ